jgi:hypothetical protein
VGIRDMADDQPADDHSPWFTLQGIRYGNQKPNTSGVYIRNGQKLVVK